MKGKHLQVFIYFTFVAVMDETFFYIKHMDDEL